MRPSGRRLWRGASGQFGCVGRQGQALGADLEDRTDEGRDEEDRYCSRSGQVRDGAGRACVLALRNEGRVRGMVGREELRPLREELEAVDVAEGPAQR